MVKIGIYDGIDLEYEDKLFFANIDEVKITASTEDELKDLISRSKRQLDENKLNKLMIVPEFRIVLSEHKFFIEAIKMVNKLSNEAFLDFNKEGLSINTLDPANVCMTNMYLHSASAVEWNVPQRFIMGIALSNLVSVLNKTKISDVLVLSNFKDKDKELLKINMQGDTLRTYIIDTVELEKLEKVPQLSFDSKITLPTSYLCNAISSVDIVADTCIFAFKDKSFIISAKSDGNSKVEIENKSSDMVVLVNPKEEYKSKYSIEYLKKFFTLQRIIPFVEIQFRKDYPLKIRYVVLDKLELQFILAPRVDND